MSAGALYLVIRTFAVHTPGWPAKTCAVDVVLCGPHMLQLPASVAYDVEEVEAKGLGGCEACEQAPGGAR